MLCREHVDESAWLQSCFLYSTWYHQKKRLIDEENSPLFAPLPQQTKTKDRHLTQAYLLMMHLQQRRLAWLVVHWKWQALGHLQLSEHWTDTMVPTWFALGKRKVISLLRRALWIWLYDKSKIRKVGSRYHNLKPCIPHLSVCIYSFTTHEWQNAVCASDVLLSEEYRAI